MENNTRKVFKFVGVPLIAGSLLLSLTPAIASADTSGGVGGGGGESGGRGHHWVSVTGNNAYDKFLDRTGYNQSYTERYIRGTTANVNVCKRSQVIWFIRSGNNGNWSHNYTGATHGSQWRGSGTISNPTTKIGRAPSSAEYASFKRWDRQENGHRINKKPGYTIVCSGAFEVKPDRTGRNVERSRSSKVTDTDSVTFTRPYTHTTTVSPRMNPSGKLNAQSDSVQTNFGKLWDQWSNRSSGSPASLRNAVSTAVNKDKDLEHVSVDLNDENQSGLGEGGVLDVNEHTRYATIRASSETTTTTVRRCDWIERWNPNTGRYDSREYRNCNNTSTDRTVYDSSTSTGTQQNTAFWQILSVQCNIDGFNELLDSDSSLHLIQRLNQDEDTPGILRTKKYNSQPNRLDFGDSRNTTAAKAATADEAFFTEQCAFVCTAEPNGSMDNGSDQNMNGANIHEGSGDTGSGAIAGNVPEGLSFVDTWEHWDIEESDSDYAQIGGASRIPGDDPEELDVVNSGEFDQFRDNEEQDYTLDVWYPAVSSINGVNYNGEEASRTRWIVNENGTPEEEASFRAGNQALEQGAVTAVDGLSRVFTGKSYWASDEDAPQRISTIWDYNVTTQTAVPDTVGFGVNTSLVDEGRTSIDTTKTAVCYASYNGENEAADNATTESSLHGELDYDSLIRENGDHTGKYELEINFPRAVAEGQAAQNDDE